MPALPTDILATLLEALRTHRNARRAAKLAGVNQTTAWRIAKKHGIALISLSEHLKARRFDPEFVARQAPAAREGASRWLKAQHAKAKFHKKSIEGARRNLTRLNSDPAFRQASSERLKRLHEDPAFGRKAEAARHEARKRRKAQHREQAIEAALRTLTRLDDDPALRLAASERLNRLLHNLPALRAKEAAARPARNRGFAIAPILYLLGLIGVGAGVLFSGYSQILRSNQTMSNTLASKNDLQGTATTLAASSWLSTDQTLLCPPMVGSNSPSTPSTKCSTATGAITVGTSFANAVAANLPANYASVSSAGSPVEVGVFAAGSGAKVLDPWGHYYIYCRWENSIGTANAIMVISAGADGKLATNCGSTTAGGDNLFVVWTTAVTQNRAAVWQTTTAGTSVTGAQFGATGTQVNIQTNGNVSIPGTLGVSGATALGTAGLSVTGSTSLAGLSASTGTFSGALSGTNGTFSGTLSATGTTTLGALSAGTSTLSSLSVTNNATVGGTLGVTGALTAGSSTLSSLAVTGTTYLGGNATTSNGVVQIGTSVAASGVSSPLLTVGKAVSNVYPFTVDQYGAVTGGAFTGTTFTGNLVGSQSGGSVAATTLSASGAATLSSTLAVTGVTTLSAQLNGTSAIFSGNVQAASFTGTMSLGGGGVTISGVVPVANGGTGQTNATSALSALFSGAGTISQMIPGADLVNNSVTTTQLSTTGVTAGTYTSVTVGADGRVTAGTGAGGLVSSINDGSGDSVTVGTSSIVYSIGSSTVGNWTSTGLMVGSSKAALDKLDVYGATAIGTSYAGTTAAPTNGLIVQGNVAIGTSTANGALNVNGTVTATTFSGSGAGLTNIGTSALSGTVGTGNGGTGTNTVFTQGSVVFAGASGVYSQDNSNFFWDGTNHRLGIGTAVPLYTLDIIGQVAVGPVYNTGGATPSKVIFKQANLAQPSYTNDSNGYINYYADPTGGTYIRSLDLVSGSVNTASRIKFFTSINTGGVPTEAMRIDSTGNVGIGTTAPQALLDVNGEVKIESNNLLEFNNGNQSGGIGANISFDTTNNDLNIQAIHQGTGYLPILLNPSGGNVAIGTTTTNGALNVNGTVTATNFSGGTAGLTGIGVSNLTGITGTPSSTTYLTGNGTWSTATATLSGGVANYMAYWTSATAIGTANVYYSGGNIGIGTTSPTIVAGKDFTSTATQLNIADLNSGDNNGAMLDIQGYNGAKINLVHTQAGSNLKWMQMYDDNGFLTFRSIFDDGSNFETNNILVLQHSNGNVGIGTTSPQQALSVYSSGNVPASFNSTSSSNMQININSTTGHNANIVFQNNGANEWYLQNASSNNAFNIFGGDANGNPEPLTILQSGYVGFGTTSPSSQLTVVSPGNTTSAYFTVLPQNLSQSVNIGYNHIWEAGSNGANNLTLDSQSTGYLLLQTNGGTGNVGIATTTPHTTLEVNGNITTTGAYAALGNNVWYNIQGTMIGASSSIYSYGPICTGNTSGSCNGSSGVVVGSANTSATVNIPNSGASFFNGGNVGIGNTSPQVTLDVTGTIRDAAGADASPYTNGRIFVYGGTGVDTTNFGYLGYGQDANMRIVYSSTSQAHNLIFGTSSASNNTGTFTPELTIDHLGDLTFAAANPVFTSGGSWIQFPYGAYFSGGTSYFQTQAQFRAGVHNDSAGYMEFDGGTSGYSYFSGNVGIGITAPNNPLQVVSGAANTAGDSITFATAQVTGPNWAMSSNNSGSSNAEFLVASNAANAVGVGGSIGFAGRYSSTSQATFASILGASEDGSYSGYLAFGTRRAGVGNSQISEHMRIDGAGNVGIGTTVPAFDSHSATFLAVNNATAHASSEVGIGGNASTAGDYVGAFEFYNSSLSAADKRIAAIYSGTPSGGATNSGDLEFYTWNAGAVAENMVITPAGLIGIGTPVPQSTLEIYGSSGVTSMCDISSVSNSGVCLEANNGAGSAGLITGINGALNSVQPLDLQPFGGSVGIGKTSPGYTLDVNGIGQFSGGTQIGAGIAQGYYGDGGNLAIRAYNVGGSTIYFQSYGGGSTWGTWNGSGLTVYASTYANNYYHNSDRRLKDNIKPVAGLDIVEKLNGVTFNWKKDGKPSAGVVAQDVEKIMPEAVATDQKGMKSVSYDTLIAPMIEAIKELKAANDNSAKEIAALHEEIKALKAATNKSGSAKP
jgi:fibronectin-binding autotransporter adhesin